jgi:hypothetical protein
MWPNVALTDLLRFVYEGTLLGQQIRTTWAYRVTSLTGPAATLVDALEAFRTDPQTVALKNAFLDCVPSNYTLNNVAYQWHHADSWYSRMEFEIDEVGANGVALTPNIQAGITRRGVLARRQGVGGIRIPVASEAAQITGGLVTNATLLKLRDLASLMDDKIFANTIAGTSMTFTPVIIRQTGTPEVYTNEVAETFAQETVRVMRRRTVGLGI